MNPPRCGCAAVGIWLDGLEAYGAGGTVLLLEDAEPPVMVVVCAACGEASPELLDHQDDAALEPLPVEGHCQDCGAPLRVAPLGFEGAGRLKVGDQRVSARVCSSCRRVSLADGPTGRASAVFAGWVHARDHQVAVARRRGQPVLAVDAPDSLGESEVPGLCVIEDWVGAEACRALLTAIDSEVWLEDLKRRVQHHGWRYDYRRRTVERSAYLGPLPAWGDALAERLVDEALFLTRPDQIIVNEYLPGQGISRHVDAPAFGPRVASLSLGSTAEMVFEHEGVRVRRLLRPGSLIVLRGPARTGWTHAIPARKSDPAVDGSRVERSRRVSLTFRTVAGGASAGDIG